MKRLLLASSFVVVWLSVSCNRNVDLGGTDTSDDESQGGENDAGSSGGTSAKGGNAEGGSRSGDGQAGETDGGDAGNGANTGGSGASGNEGGAGMGGVAGATSGSGGTGALAGGGSTNVAGGGGGFGGAAGVSGGVGGSPQCGASGGASASGCPSCPVFDPTDLVETCVLGSDGLLFTSSFDASVTVVNVVEVGAMSTRLACQGTGVTMTSGTSLFVLVEAMDQRRWTLVLRMPNLPSDFFVPSEPFELSVATFPGVIVGDPPDQTIQLRRGPDLVLFGTVATWAPIRGLDGSGVAVADEGGLCLGPNMLCRSIHQRTRVAIGASEALFVPHQTQRVDDFSVTVGEAHEPDKSTGFCDFGEVRQVAGIRIPP